MNYGIIVKENNIVVGYLFADINSEQIINKFLKENFLRVFIYLLFNPRFIMEKVLELFSKFSSKNKSTSDEVSLFLIAVDTRLGGKGYGKELMNHFEGMLKSNNERSYTLSVRKTNQQALEFYLKNNFIQLETNDKSIKFRKVFDS